MRNLILIGILLCFGSDISLAQMAEKSCPEERPVRRYGVGATACNQATSPNGNLVEPACAYSQCSGNPEGLTAQCACYNFTTLGLSSGQPDVYWDCIFSDCDCPDPSLVQEGDVCDVSIQDLINNQFTAPYRISGSQGCSLGNRSNCFCLPDEDDINSPWYWQCDAQTRFLEVLPYEIEGEATETSDGTGLMFGTMHLIVGLVIFAF